MQYFSLLLALAASLASAVPFGHDHMHKKRNAPANPIQVASAEYLCDVKSDLAVIRDLGFVGKIQDTVIYTYGDTSSTTGSFYMTSDSSSIATNDPCYVLNTQRSSDGAHPASLVSEITAWGENNADDAMGGTNIIPTGGDSGAMFYLVNHRPGGQSTIKGAGVASVFLSPEKNVTTFRLAEYWWDSSAGEPWFGDIGAYSDGTYIYGYGHGHSDHMYVYLTRCALDKYQDLNNWEYYDGSTSAWSKQRLYNPTPQQAIQFNDVDGAAWAVAQGQVIWSPFYQKILWVYGADWAENDQGDFGVYARTASRPEGPWSSPITLYTVRKATPTGAVYCMIANPYFDDSGKSIILTVDNGNIEATKVIFQ